MKIDLKHKEANLLMAILWELAEESSAVLSTIGAPMWRLGETGHEIADSVIAKLEEANAVDNAKSGKDRDLSGSPKGSIQEARWTK